MELSDEEGEEKEEKRDKKTTNNTDHDSKVNKIKKYVQNIDGFLAGSGNFRRQILPMLYWKKELEMLLRLLKTFGMEEVKAVEDAYPCDGNMAKKPNSILFQLGREIAVSEKCQTELRLSQVANSSCT